MSLTLTSPAQTAQVVVTLQLHWTLNSREVPEKQVKNTDIEKLPCFSIPPGNIEVFKPFYGSSSTFSNVRFPFKRIDLNPGGAL